MAGPINATIAAPGTFVFPLDYRQAPFNANVEVNVGAATVSYHVDYTLVDTNYPPNAGLTQTWTPLVYFPVGSSATISAPLQAPFAMIRLVVVSLTGGPITVNILQGDFVGT